MGKKILIVSLVMVLGAALLGGSILVAHDLTGRDVVETGRMTTIEGALRYEANEWYLDTDEESYLLHFGNRAYLESTGLDLEEGDLISVDGYAAGGDVAVASVRTGGETYLFRGPDGTPEWAGRGERYARGGSRAPDDENGRGKNIGRSGDLESRRMGCRQAEEFRQGAGAEGGNGLKLKKNN